MPAKSSTKVRSRQAPLPQPMLAKAGDLPRGSGYAFEIKWDGFRALLDTRNGYRLFSRRGWNMTDRVAELVDFPARGIFDGELVAFDEETRPSFPLLCDRVLHRRTSSPVMLAVFDVLEMDGEPTWRLPYSERRRLLEDADLGGRAWFTPETFEDGLALFAAVVEAQLEGVVAKRLSDPYRPGERGWVKTKNRDYWRFGRERELARGGRSRRRGTA